jgi:hypothetical protein
MLSKYARCGQYPDVAASGFRFAMKKRQSFLLGHNRALHAAPVLDAYQSRSAAVLPHESDGYKQTL